tara:strand:+ start:896 stop:1105 length:210 start_codon:yes stop_codon:yes gene_type:complete
MSNPIVEQVLDEIIAEVCAKVTQEQLDAAYTRILKIGAEKGTEAMVPELFKHPVTGEALDYEESRMLYG